MGLASGALKRLRKELARTPLDEIVEQARGYLGDAGGAVRSGYERLDAAAPSLTSAYRAGLRITPAAPLADFITPEEERKKRSGMSLFDAALDPLKNAERLGHGLVREPLSYAARELLTKEGGGSPFSGKEYKELKREAKTIANPAVRAAALGGLEGLSLATNPLTYVGGVGVAGKAARGGTLAEKALAVLKVGGVGTFGGSTPLRAGARAAGFGLASGAGRELGGEAAEAVGLPRGAGELAGGLALPIGASVATSRLRAPGTVLGAVGDLPPGAGHTPGRPLRIAAEVGDEAFGASRGVRPGDVEAAKAAAAARSPLARLGIPEPPPGTAQGARIANVRTPGAPLAPGTAGGAAKARAQARATSAAPASQRGVLGTAASLSREASLGGDIGQAPARGILGMFQAIGSNPVGAVKNVPVMWYRGIRAAVSPTYADDYMQNSPTWKRFGTHLQPQRVTQGGVSVQGGVIDEFGQQHGILGLPARAWSGADKMVFDRFFRVYNAETSKVVADAMSKKFAGRYGQAAVDKAAAGWIQGISLGVPKNTANQNVLQKAVGAIAEKLPLISPNRARGDVAMATKWAGGGMEGYMARRLWAGALATSVATATAVTWVLEGTPPEELLDPRSPKSIINPSNRQRFLSIGIGEGKTISPFQAIKSPARLLFGAPAAGVAAGVEEYRVDGDIRDAARVLLATWAEEQWDESSTWYTNRLAIPFRTGYDVLRNRDYYGNEITTADFTEDPEGWVAQVAAHLGRSQVPIFASPFVERGYPHVPGTGPTMQERAIDTLTGWAANVETRRPARLPDDVHATLSAEVKRHGKDPAGDPLGAYYRLDLPQDEQAAFEAAHPEVRQYTRSKTVLQGKLIDRPKGRDAERLYDATVGEAKQQQIDALRALEGQSLTGDEYRQARERINTDYAGTRRGAKAAIWGSVEEGQQALDRRWSKSDEDVLDKAVDGYYDLQQSGSKAEDRDAFFDARREYLDSLGPALKARVLDTQEQRAAAISETEHDFFLAQREMDAYQQISPYRYMSVEEARNVNKIIARAKDRQALEPWMKLKSLILLDDTVSYTERLKAYRAVGGKLTNRERRRFFQESRYLPLFYSSLLREEAEALIAA